MSDSVYALLPEIIRERDERAAATSGSAPLRDLMSVVQAEIDALHSGLDQLYDDWFIETCAPWVVPYLADLVGRGLLRPLGPEPRDRRRAMARARILVPRRDVANTIAHRRRKGTLHLLEDLAEDVAGWPARASESYRLLGWDQHLDHLHLERGGTVDLRDGDGLARLDGAFDRLAHRVDVRTIDAQRPWTQGRWNIPSVALHVWRLGSFPVTGSPARALDEVAGNAYTFSVLGNDAPLFARPQREPQLAIATERDRPVPISRHALARDIKALYGRDRSLFVEVAHEAEGVDGQSPTVEPIEASEILVTSLRRTGGSDGGWPDLAWPPGDPEHGIPRPRVAIDPETGRLMFPPEEEGLDRVRVTYRYGFSAPMGGGEYRRSVRDPEAGPSTVFPLGAGERHTTLAEAVAAWHASAVGGQRRAPAIIEIVDSDVYGAPVDITVGEGESLQLRARPGARPVIRILDTHVDKREALTVKGAGCFALEGLLIEGRGVEVRGDIRELRIRHCTLVPGWALDGDCNPQHGGEASLRIRAKRTKVTIEHSILGPIHVLHDEVANAPCQITIADSILDGSRPSEPVIQRGTGGSAHVVLDVRRTTVFGRILAHAVELGEDAIFMGGLAVERRQVGCLRFCYVPEPLRTPSRFRCQPETATAELDATGQKDPFLEARIAPRFTARRYGNPGYAQLRLDCADEIREGASDEAEMGAFHDLYQPQRISNLRMRLDESTPAAMDAGLIFAT